MQEMRAAQAHTDLAMVTESAQIDVRIRRAARPAFERLRGAPRGNRTPNPLIKSQPGLSGVLNSPISQEHWDSARAKTSKLAGAETIIT
jgi:hypothetical protein